MIKTRKKWNLNLKYDLSREKTLFLRMSKRYQIYFSDLECPHGVRTDEEGKEGNTVSIIWLFDVGTFKKVKFKIDLCLLIVCYQLKSGNSNKKSPHETCKFLRNVKEIIIKVDFVK